MKNKILQYATILLTIVVCNLNQTFSQSTSSDPFSPAPGPNLPFGGGDFLGWTVGVGIPVNIRHDGVKDIDFYLGGAALANKRMTLLGTSSGTPGYLGLSPNFATGFAPAFRLDVDARSEEHTSELQSR